MNRFQNKPWFLGENELDQSDRVPLASSTTLEGTLAEKVFYTNFVVSGLEELRQTQAQILRLLENGMRD